MDENLRKNIILEHYNNPVNKGLVKEDGYIKVNMNSSTCIDNLDFMVKIENKSFKYSLYIGLIISVIFITRTLSSNVLK